VEVSGAVGVGDGVEVAVGVAVDVGVGPGVGVTVGVPNKPVAGSRFHTRASGDDPARGDSFNPSCRTVSRSSRTARNQKRAIARKAEVMAGMVTRFRKVRLSFEYTWPARDCQPADGGEEAGVWSEL
jgi:hypothetical protein